MSSLAFIIRSGLIWRALPPEQEFDSNNRTEKDQLKSPIKEQFYPIAAKQCQDLHELCIEQYQSAGALHTYRNSHLSFGIDAIDRALPAAGLSAGTIHEWSLSNPLTEQNNTPHSLFAWMAFRAWKQLQNQSGANLRFIFWIGKEVWPSPHTLAQISQGEDRKGAFFGQNIFLDVAGEKERLWSIETALRSPASALVIAPLATSSLTVSRRLLLAAERGGSIGLFSIPQRMRETTTAALSRWEISPVPSPSDYARWRLELTKWKGAHPDQRSWEVELSPPSVRDLYFSGNSLQLSGNPEKISSGDPDYEHTRQQHSREKFVQERRSASAFSLHIPADVVDRAVQKKTSEAPRAAEHSNTENSAFLQQGGSLQR